MTNKPADNQNRPPAPAKDAHGKACPPRQDEKAEGTTGAGNLSPGGASRTGGATGGVDPERERHPPDKRP